MFIFYAVLLLSLTNAGSRPRQLSVELEDAHHCAASDVGLPAGNNVKVVAALVLVCGLHQLCYVFTKLHGEENYDNLLSRQVFNRGIIATGYNAPHY